MLVVNASYDPDVVIQETINNLCPNKKYQFSAWIRDLNSITGDIPANLTFLVNGVGEYITGNILTGIGSPTSWQQVGFTFQATGTFATISIRNNQTGGQGNDWAIDDIYFGDCIPNVVLQPDSTTCMNPALTVNATITDATQLYGYYQWQVNKADGNGFINDGPPKLESSWNTNSYVTTDSLPNPLTNANNGWMYRVIVGTTLSDLSSSKCYYTNTQTLLIWGCEVILPIKFISIEASLDNNKGKITWEIDNQIGINHYELEKSTDGKTFNKISNISILNIKYTSFDDNIFDGENYYRIKIINNNGTFSYSQIVTLNIKNSIVIFPNPSNNTVTISSPIKIKKVDIIDVSGRILIENTNSNTIEINNLPIGFYNIRIVDISDNITNLNFIKK